MRVVCHLTLLLALLPTSSLAAGLEEYGCHSMVSGNGERETAAAPGLRVLDYNSKRRLIRFLPEGHDR